MSSRRSGTPGRRARHTFIANEKKGPTSSCTYTSAGGVIVSQLEVHAGPGSCPRDAHSWDRPKQPMSWLSWMIVWIVHAALSLLSRCFLPNGYPESVTPDYALYQLWDSVQALFSAVTGTLASRAVLHGLGVGDAAASATGALGQWVIRDGFNKLLVITLGATLGQNFDSNVRRWRLVADAANDLAMGIELASVAIFPRDLLLVPWLTAQAFYVLTGTAGGATRHSMTHHFARVGNTADVSAKDSNQEAFVGILGALLGYAVAVYTTADQLPIIFTLAAACHLAANYFAVRAITLNTMNITRASALFLAIAEGVSSRKASSDGVHWPTILPSPAIVSYWEPILTPALPRIAPPPPSVSARFWRRWRCPAMSVGASFASVVNICRMHAIDLDAKVSSGRAATKVQSRLFCSSSSTVCGNAVVAFAKRFAICRDARDAARYHIVLHEDATPQDTLVAILSVFVTACEFQLPTLPSSRPNVTVATDWVLQHAPELLAVLTQSGWSTNRLMISTGSWRVTQWPPSIESAFKHI